MKKILLICMSIFCAAGVYADGYKTCKVAGTTGTVEVSVEETDLEKGIATVRFSNDTNEPVNVRYTIRFNSGGRTVATKNGAKRVAPQYEETMTINCGKAYQSAEVSSVSGNKCQ